MKRLLVSIIAVLYFAVSSGFTIHVHYCMGQIVSASVVPEASDEHHCTHCGMKKTKGGNGCCKEEQKIVKSTAEGALLKSIPLIAPLVFTLPAAQHYILLEYPAKTGNILTSFTPHAPPGPPSCPVYLSIRNLRI